MQWHDVIYGGFSAATVAVADPAGGQHMPATLAHGTRLIAWLVDINISRLQSRCTIVEVIDMPLVQSLCRS
jgi:hypothetical protein